MDRRAPFDTDGAGVTATLETTWETHQEFEAGWWGDCSNTFGEEAKQITYAHRMGLVNNPVNGKWPVYDLAGRSVLDLGGGPASILLKTINGGRRDVVDPCAYPAWVAARYKEAGIVYWPCSAEDYRGDYAYDECWIYNVLQHVKDPEKVVSVALENSRLVRLFEWVWIEPHLGHPHQLRPSELDIWLDGRGSIEEMDENGCVGGTAYYGVFSS